MADLPDQNPAPEPRPLRRISHYEILEELGRGGMGVVYRARDLTLDREVALKCPRPELAQAPEGRERFVKEGRAASRLSHPGIVPIFEVFEEGGLPWLVMELVQGGSLAATLRTRGALPAEEAIRHAESLADALALAHRKRILHRDITPRNVLISEDGRARLMDFGLARPYVPPDETSAATTRSSDPREKGRIVGTPGYMSPEQALGKDLDPRSDIFSLGAVLYEICTGRPAFTSSAEGDILDTVLNREPVAITRLNYEVPEELERIIRKCLAKRREERYQHAEDLLADVRALRRRFESGSSAATAQAAPPRRRWILWSAAAAAVIGALALLAPWRPPSGGPSPSRAPRDVVAVLPFEDRTGEQDGDLRGRMIADLLAADLSESAELRSMGGERLDDILVALPAGSTQAEIMERVSALAEVDWLVTGSVYREEGSYLASVEIFRTGASAPAGAFRVGATRGTALVDLASARVRTLLLPDASAGDSHLASGARSSVSDEARLHEHLGRIALAEDRYVEALSHFERALEIEPRFTSASVRLAETLNRAGYGQRAIEAADRALRLVEGPGANATTRLSLEARAIHARVRGDRAGELDARRALAERYGDVAEVLLALAGVLVVGGSADEGLITVERALALDARDPRGHLERARALAALTRIDEASAELAEADRLYGSLGGGAGTARVAMARGHIAFRQGAYDEAARAYRKAAETFRSARLEVRAAEADKAEGDAALKQGRLADARTLYDRAIVAARAGGNHRLIVSTLGSLGGQLYLKGDYPAAEPTLREAVEEARQLDNAPLLLTPMINLAGLLNYTNRVGEGRALASEAVRLARERSDRPKEITALFLLADADYQQGRISEAAQSYEDLVRLERSPGGSRENLARALMSLASILATSGSTRQAHEGANEAVELERELGNLPDLGYALTVRALVRGHLCLWAEAEVDLDEAERLATTGSERLDHLIGTITLERGLLAAMQGRWEDADGFLDEARRAGEASGAIGQAVPALSAASDVARRLGRIDRAVTLARGALEHPRALADERTQARASLAAALAAAGSTREAEAEARRALDEAESMGLTLVAAHAAGVLLELGSPDRDAVQARGRQAIEKYLAAAPGDQVEAMRSRADIRELVQALIPRAASHASITSDTRRGDLPEEES